MTRASPPWDDGQVETLRSEWAAGTPAAAIGELVGRTKNACIGKADRLDLGLHPMGHNPRRSVLPTPAEWPDHHHCVWPDGDPPDHTFCCEPIAAPQAPYCRSHMRRAYHKAA